MSAWVHPLITRVGIAILVFSFAFAAVAFAEFYLPVRQTNKMSSDESAAHLHVPSELAGVDQRFNRSSPDSNTKSAARESREEERGIVGYPLGNGVILPTGVSPIALKTFHPEGNCFQFRGAEYCEFENPSSELCLTGARCGDATYRFEKGKFTEFTANFDQQDWAVLLRTTKKTLGEGRNGDEELPPGGIVVEWKLPQGTVSFIHWTRTDIQGNPVKDPYEIAMGSDSYLGPRKEKTETASISGQQTAASNISTREATIEKLYTEMDFPIEFLDEPAKEQFKTFYFNC